ncbi:MAG: hypothetical protein ACK5S5_14465 [Planctomycetota bacterium]
MSEAGRVVGGGDGVRVGAGPGAGVGVGHGVGAAPARAGSWRPLLAVAAAFLAAFTALRSSSDFLAIEADAPAARTLAARHGVPLADALALRELVGLQASTERWHDVVQRYAGLRASLGDPLAAIAATASDAAVVAAVMAAGGGGGSTGGSNGGPADGDTAARDGAAGSADAGGHAARTAAAWQAFAPRQEAAAGLRFLSIRDRFAKRAVARE